MAVAAGSGGEEGGFTEINVTPLTDVLLVLLIIFLITGSSITAPAHDINLPEVITREKAENAHIVIDVTADGRLFVGNRQFDPEKTESELQPFLQRMALRRHTDRVIVNADREAPYGLVVSAMNAARFSGLEKIALATKLEQSAAASGEKPAKVEVVD